MWRPDRPVGPARVGVSRGGLSGFRAKLARIRAGSTRIPEEVTRDSPRTGRIVDNWPQGMPEVMGMDLLATLTGSRVRADVLAILFAGHSRSWKPMELEALTGRSHSPIYRELLRLVAAGLLRKQRRVPHQFEVDADTPVAREIRRLVLQTRGRVPRLRHALVQLRSRTLAWAVGGSLRGTPGRTSLIVLTSAPKSLVRLQLAKLTAAGTDVHVMSVSEWVTRLDKGDVFLRQARRARKLWILGTWDELARRERAEIDSRRLLQTVRRNWREELSDEWDEDWDPASSVPGIA